MNPVGFTYKITSQGGLDLLVFGPGASGGASVRPAAVFFHGGGWSGGRPDQFAGHCAALAAAGVIGVTAQYRLRNTHATSPAEAVHDARSAMRWVRAHADKLGIDADRIAAGGGSAGGHLALCCTLPAYADDPQDDAAVSCTPCLLSLFNPVVDTSPDGFGAARFGEYWRHYSPLHHVEPGMSPTVIFHGEDDDVVRIESVRQFEQAMLDAGNCCEVHAYPGCGHGFFNRPPQRHQALIEAMLAFFASHGYVDSPSSAG